MGTTVGMRRAWCFLSLLAAGPACRAPALVCAQDNECLPGQHCVSGRCAGEVADAGPGTVGTSALSSSSRGAVSSSLTKASSQVAGSSGPSGAPSSSSAVAGSSSSAVTGSSSSAVAGSSSSAVTGSSVDAASSTAGSSSGPFTACIPRVTGSSSSASGPAAPSLVVLSSPAAATATFSGPPGATAHECRVDAAAFTACTSPWTVSTTAGATGTVTVHATGTGGPGPDVSRPFRVGRLGVGFNGPVKTILPLRDGRYLVGGSFTTHAPEAGGGITSLRPDGVFDASFSGLDAGFDDDALCVLLERGTSGTPTGKILVGGQFTRYNGAAVPARLVRLLADGTLDATFNAGGAGFNGRVNVVVQELATDGSVTGRLLVGGDFTTYDGTNVPDRLVALSSTGAWDNTFNPGGAGFNGEVRALLQQLTTGAGGGLPDGKVLVGGTFSQHNGTDVPDHAVRLDAVGAVDTSFNTGGTGFSGLFSTVGALALERGAAGYNGNILVGGLFNGFNAVAAAQVPDSLVRLTPAGLLDATFNGAGTAGAGSGIFGNVRALLQDPASLEWYVGGNLVQYNGTGVPTHLLRVNADGTPDAAFPGVPTGFDNVVATLAAEIGAGGVPTGKWLVGGAFRAFNGAPVPAGLVRFNADGTLDAAWRSGAAGIAGPDTPTALGIAVRADGRPVVVGAFNALDGTDVPRSLVRVDENGAWDPSFNAVGRDLDGPVSAIIEELDTTGAPTGRFLVGGSFTHLGTAAVPADLVRLSTDGALDTTFNSGATGFEGAGHQVTQVVQERGLGGLPSGRLLVRGVFARVNGLDTPDGIVRLQSDGSVDLSFDAGGTGLVPMAGSQLVVQELSTATGLPTGKLLVGGDFTHYNGADATHVVPIGLMRLDADGAYDATFGGGSGFTILFAGSVRAVLLERSAGGLPTGNLVVGGAFNNYNGTAVTTNLVRLGRDGLRDVSFNSAGPGADGAVEVLSAERTATCLPSGRTWAGGAFTTYGGTPARGLVRVLGDGRADTTSNTGSGVLGTVQAIVEETDALGVPTGRLVIGGTFTVVDGKRRMGLARVDLAGATDEAFAGQLR